MTRQSTFNFISQKSATDCGPTCLAMVLDYYGRKEPMEKLRQITQSTERGTTMLGMRRGAESLGLDTMSGQMTWDNLLNYSFLPAIVLWEQNHYVMVYGIDTNKKGEVVVSVADPLQGLMEYTKDEFCEHWGGGSNREVGAVLLLEPSAAFYKQPLTTQEPQSKRSFLKKYIRSSGVHLVLIVLTLLMMGLFSLGIPYKVVQLTVELSPYIQTPYIYLIALFIWLLFVCLCYLDRRLDGFASSLSARVNTSLLSDFILKLMLLPMTFFDRRNLSDVLQRIKDHNRVEEFMSSQLLSTLYMWELYLIYGGVLFYYHPLLLIVYVCGLVAYIGWVNIALKRKRGLQNQLTVAEQKESERSIELIYGIQEIKLQGCELRKRKEWQAAQQRVFVAKHRVYRQEKLLKHVGILITQFINLALITVFMVVAPTPYYVSRLLMLVIIMGILYFPSKQMVHFLEFWQELKWSLSRIDEIYQQVDESDTDRPISYLEEEVLDIRIEQLSFAYPSGEHTPVLHNLSLTIPYQQLTVLQGVEGTGKSTLMRLILGLFEPLEGQISIGRTPLSQIQLMWWRSQCGSILADSYIFADSILVNITLSSAYIEWERLAKIAEWVQLDTYIELLPFKYDTKIGTQRSELTVALRERILWARLLYKDPSFLLLDQTSLPQGLSLFGSRKDEIRAWLQTKTVLWATYQPEIVALAQQVVQMDDLQSTPQSISQ